MAQIVPGAPNLGAQLGSGLSAGLSALAEQKFAQLARREVHRERASRLSALGIPPAQADYLAGLGDKYSFVGASNFFNSGGGQEQQAYGEPTPQRQPMQMAQPQQQGLEQLASQVNQIPGASPSPEQLMLQSLASGNPLSPIEATLQSIQERQIASPGQTAMVVQPSSNVGQPNTQQGMPEIPPEVQQAIDSQQQAQQQETSRARKPGIFGSPGVLTTGGIDKQQEAIEKHNASFNKELDKKEAAAIKLLQISDRMDSELDTRKTSSGIYGQIQEKLGLPKNESTSNFDSDAESAAILRATLIPGNTTNERLKASRREKPNISQPIGTQRARIAVMRNDALDVLDQVEARRQLIEENGNNEPKNMKYAVEKRARELKAERKSVFKIGSVVSESNSKGIPEGATSIGEDGNPYVRKNGKWVPA